MTALLDAHDMQVIDITASALRLHCGRLPATQVASIDLSNPVENLVVNAHGGLRVGDVVPCVPLSRDRERECWRGSIALGKTMRFLTNKERVPGSSRAALYCVHQDRAIVQIDGGAFGILDRNASAVVLTLPRAQLGTFAVGCPGDDPDTGLIHAVLPSTATDESIQLASVLCVWEYRISKRNTRKVRVAVKTTSGMLGLASASENLNWDLPPGQHVNVEFRHTRWDNPPTDTNCSLVGHDFQRSQPPREGTKVEAIVVNVLAYGAFCLVANGVTAMMHRNDCELDQSQDVTQHFFPGDHIQGVIHSGDTARGAPRLRFAGLIERRSLPTWLELCTQH